MIHAYHRSCQSAPDRLNTHNIFWDVNKHDQQAHTTSTQVASDERVDYVVVEQEATHAPPRSEQNLKSVQYIVAFEKLVIGRIDCPTSQIPTVLLLHRGKTE